MTEKETWTEQGSVKFYEDPTYVCAQGHKHPGSSLGMEIDGRMRLICPTCIVLHLIDLGFETFERKDVK